MKLNTNLNSDNDWIHNFEESEEIAGLVQAEVEGQLNGYSQTDTHESNYNLGIHPDYEVATEKGWVPLRDLAIGTVLVDGGTVRGIVKEGVTEVTTKGFSKAQLVWSQSEGKWKRQHNEAIVNGKQVLWQLLTDKNVFHVRMPGVPELSVRDYAEINDPMLEDMYWTTLMGR